MFSPFRQHHFPNISPTIPSDGWGAFQPPPQGDWQCPSSDSDGPGVLFGGMEFNFWLTLAATALQVRLG